MLHLGRDFFRFEEPVFLPLKRLRPGGRVKGLVQILSASLLVRKIGADTISTLIGVQSL